MQLKLHLLHLQDSLGSQLLQRLQDYLVVDLLEEYYLFRLEFQWEYIH
tara:strand:- start:612 stop:755 length:144 start_codon:yes stop_codon:yes gene_type:complete